VSGELAIVNGEIKPLAEATVSVLDLGFLRGVGAFETLRTYAGHPHLLAQHLQRLARSAAALDIDSPFTAAGIRAAIAESTRRGGAEEFRLNLILTPGMHTGGVFGAADPTAVMLLRAMTPPPRAWYDEGIGVVTFTGERIHPEFKTTSYLTGKRGLMQAEAAGAQEALYVDAEGFVAEGVTSNVIVVRDGALWTPNLPSLPGITRAGIWRLAEELGIACGTTAIHTDDLTTADEVWICSAIRELVPVISVDGRPVGDGRPGPLARRLGPLFHQRCIDEAAAEAATATTG